MEKLLIATRKSRFAPWMLLFLGILAGSVMVIGVGIPSSTEAQTAAGTVGRLKWNGGATFSCDTGYTRLFYNFAHEGTGLGQDYNSFWYTCVKTPVPTPNQCAANATYCVTF